MAKTTALSSIVEGMNLVNGAAAWRTTDHCGQDLLLVFRKDENGKGLPTHIGAWGAVIEERTDLSTLTAAFKNNVDNREIVGYTYPDTLYEVRVGTLRGDALLIKK